MEQKVDIEEIDRISKYAKAVENIEKTRKTPEEKNYAKRLGICKINA